MTERIDIVVSERGSRTVKRKITDIGDAAERSSRQFDLLRRVLGLLGGAAVITQLVRLADSFTNIQNRLRTVTETSGELAAVTNELFAIAQKTRQGFTETAEVYSRVALATRELGVTQQETLEFTESLNKAVILSGASGQEAAAGLLQLSQGLASGTLRGDELRSVLEQLPVVADVIASSMGITRGELRKMGEEGRISAEIVLEAFAKARGELDERFGKTVPTISQAFTVLRNSITQFIGGLDSANGISATFARGLIWLSENLELVARFAAAAGIALAINFAQKGVGAAIRAIARLTIAIATNPIGAIAVGITLAISALIAFGDQISLTAGSSATALDFIVVAVKRLANFFLDAVNFIGSSLGFFQNTLDDFDFLGFVRGAARGVDLVIALFQGLYAGVQAIFDDFPAYIGDVVITGLNFLIRAVNEFVDSIIATLNKIPGVTIDTLDGVIPQIENPFEGAGKSVAEAALNGFQQSLEKGITTGLVEDLANEAEQRAVERLEREKLQAEEIAKAQEGLTQRRGGEDADAQRRDRAFQNVIKALEQENMLLEFNSAQRQVSAAILETEEKLKRQLTETERERLAALIQSNEMLQIQDDILTELRGPQEELLLREQALLDLYQQGKLSVEEYTRALQDLKIAQLELKVESGEGSFADGFLLELERMKNGVNSFSAEAGSTFGKLFSDLGNGFADSIGKAVVYSEDLGASLKKVAKDAVAGLISSLIKLGLQYVANQVLAATLGTSAVALGVAQGTALAAAYAPAAAAASLASFGANAAPASAGIAATFGLTKALAIAGAAFADGGLALGPGGRRDDRLLAALSNGEFVVNAEATRRNLPMLRAINNGQTPTGEKSSSGSIALTYAPNVTVNGGDERSATELAREMRAEWDEWLEEQGQFGGRLEGVLK